MKIVFLPSSFFPETVGGTETYSHHLANDLASHGVEVSVAYHSAKPRVPLHGAQYAVEVLPERRRATRSELYSNSLGEEPAGFRAYLARERPDLLHFHAFTLGAGIDHARVAHKLGVPYVMTYHTPAMSCPRGSLIRFGDTICDGALATERCAACVLERTGLPLMAAKILAKSPLKIARHIDSPVALRLSMRDAQGRWQDSWREFAGGGRHFVACAQWCRDVLVSNGVDKNKITVLRQALPGASRQRELKLPLPQSRKLRIGCFGRFTPLKGPDIALRAMQVLAALDVVAELELVGPIGESDRPWAENLLARFKDSGTYLGVKHGEDLKSWLRGLDLIVIPGKWLETGPLTLLEAWDEAVPVVAVNLGGIKESFQGTGLEALLFAPDDVNALVNAVMNARKWRRDPIPVVQIPGQTSLTQKMLQIYRAAAGA